jgi:hypothetical protein
MSKLRMLLSAAILMASVLLPLLGMAGVQAKHGGDDPCPHRVENLPGCQ